MSESKIWPPTLREASLAFWVACYAKSVVEQIVEKGRPDGKDFMSLCNALIELESNTIGGAEFHERAEDLDKLSLVPQTQPEAQQASPEVTHK